MKLTLDQTYIYNGKFYGPGEVEIDDADAAKAIAAKMKAAQGDAPAAAEPEKPARKNDRSA